MTQTLQEISVENKTLVLNKNQFYSDKQIENSIDLSSIPSNNNQFETFIRLMPQEYLNSFESNEQKNQFLRNVYLNTYSNLIQLFIKSQSNSIFLKTKEQLGTDFDGGQLFRSLNFFSVLDIPQLKDEVLNLFNNNPCLVVNTQPSTVVEPLRAQMIKANLYLSCRAHILDFKLRKLNLTSVYDNKEFFTNDNTIVSYLFSNYVEKIKEISSNYYNSLIEILVDELNNSLESGTEFINPITNKKINFILPFDENNKEINFLSYLRFIFDSQFLLMSNNLNLFFDTTVSKNGVSFKLSNLLTTKQFFTNSIPNVDKRTLSTLDKNTFAYFIDIKNNTSDSDVTVKLVVKTEIVSFADSYITLAQSREVKINNAFATISDVSEGLINNLKEQIEGLQRFKTLIEFVFPLQKILNFSGISTILLCSNYYENSNTSFDESLEACANIHYSILEKNKQKECEDEKPDFNFSLGLNREIAKLAIQASVAIIKGIEETYDPNIIIANKLKKGAELVGTPDLSIIPYSAYLMVPPPFGPAIPLVPPWGFVYWGISAAEAISNDTRNGINGLDLQLSGSFGIKNPFKTAC
jgi:hypothetical protein